MELKHVNVLFFSVSYRPERYGIGPYAAASAEGMGAAGASVQVIAGLAHYPSWRLEHRDRWRLRRREVVGGLPVTRLRQLVPRRHTALSRGLYELTFFLHGLTTFRQWRRADVVVAVVPSLSGGLLAWAAAARHRVPLVLIIQDLSAAGARQSGILGGRLASGLAGPLEGRLFRRAAAVGVVHDSLVDSALALGVAPDRLHVVPNWSTHAPRAGSRSARPARWRDCFVVMHAGNMGLKQGLEVAVDTARLAHELGHDDLLFVLLGDGSQRAALQRSVSDLPTLEFMMPVPDDEFLALLGTADLALVTQRAEVHDMSLPSKLTAYWNASRAVVASVAHDCGTADEVRRSGGGVVVPAQDKQALLDAVLELRADPARVAALEVAGHEYARDHLSARSGVDRIVALVASAVEDGVG